MKESIKTGIIIVAALAVGLVTGYFFFGQKQAHTIGNDPAHAHNPAGQPNEEAAVWTCSMHPQIRQNEPGLCPICEMDLVPLQSNASDDPLVLQMTEAAVQLANIQTSVIGESAGKNTGQTIRLSGKIQADERRASSQVAHVPGRIEKLYVSFTGEPVVKGQKLAELYSPELVTAQRELLEAVKLQNLNPGLLQAARNKLRYWKIEPAAIEAIENEGVIRETFTLYSDAYGIVSQKRVNVGDYVQQGQPLFDLMNLSKLWVLFDAYEDDLPLLQVGSNISFTTPSVPGKTFQTRISFIDPIINPTTRTASLRAVLNNPKGTLKPEMLVYGTIRRKETGNKVLTIPRSAVLWTGKRSVVYVRLPDVEVPSFAFREVELGASLGDDYELLSGVESGEEVVTYGSFSIDAAAQLNNQASMMNRNVEVKKETLDVLPDYQASTPARFKEQLSQLSNAYLGLKDAFVETNPATASTLANDLLSDLEKVDASLLEEEAQPLWTTLHNDLESSSQTITTTSDIAVQRDHFHFLSEALIQALRVFGLEGDTLFVQHCPMAFDNEGADWLAREEAIRNPYFGDKMMKCGTVKRQLIGTNDQPGEQTFLDSSSPKHTH